MKKALKYSLASLVLMVGLLIAGVEYLNWKYNNSLSYALEQVEEGNWRPIHGYSRLLKKGSDEQLVQFASKYIAERDGQVMSNAIQLPHESDQEYLDRVNEGRRLMGFTKTTIEKLKSKRGTRRLLVQEA